MILAIPAETKLQGRVDGTTYFRPHSSADHPAGTQPSLLPFRLHVLIAGVHWQVSIASHVSSAKPLLHLQGFTGVLRQQLLADILGTHLVSIGAPGCKHHNQSGASRHHNQSCAFVLCSEMSQLWWMDGRSTGDFTQAADTALQCCAVGQVRLLCGMTQAMRRYEQLVAVNWCPLCAECPRRSIQRLSLHWKIVQLITSFSSFSKRCVPEISVNIVWPLRIDTTSR